MSRELALRVPSEIGAWVRQQPGSATDTTLALAKVLWQRRQTIGVHDPGPGDDRLKVRLEPRALRFIREATHSRDATAAIRKLLFWGVEGRALPASPSRPAIPASAKAEPRILSAAVPVRSLPSGECWTGVRIPAGLVPAYPVAAMRPSAGWNPVPQGAGIMGELVPTREIGAADVIGEIVAHPLDWVFPLAVIGGLLVLFWYGLKWLSAIGSAGKVVTGVATAAKVAPAVAAWTPQVAAGLGALFL